VRLFSNTRIYERIGGLYDASLGFWSREVRRQAAEALDLREDERLLIIGVGTGMELEYLPAWVRGAGVRAQLGPRSPRLVGALRISDSQVGLPESLTPHPS
jgi:hypothetical protein